MKTFITLTTLPTQYTSSYSWLVDPAFISDLLPHEGRRWEKKEGQEVSHIGTYVPCSVTFVGLPAISGGENGEQLGTNVAESVEEILGMIKMVESACEASKTGGI